MKPLICFSKSIILIGIKHSGKSTQAKALSKFCNVEFFDTDALIKKMTNYSARNLYNKFGKDEFLKAEANACKEINLKLKEKFLIVATGGGICENQKALNFLKLNSLFVYLQIPKEIALERILKKAKVNNLLITDLNSLPSYIAKKNPHTVSDVRTIFDSFYKERIKKYETLADITICQENLSAKEITNLIIQKLQEL